MTYLLFQFFVYDAAVPDTLQEHTLGNNGPSYTLFLPSCDTRRLHSTLRKRLFILSSSFSKKYLSRPGSITTRSSCLISAKIPHNSSQFPLIPHYSSQKNQTATINTQISARDLPCAGLQLRDKPDIPKRAFPAEPFVASVGISIAITSGRSPIFENTFHDAKEREV